MTIRSSSEWNEITPSRPPGRSISTAAGSARSIAPSSSLTSIRSAWKTRFAGMSLAEPGRRGDRSLDHLDQVSGALERLLPRRLTIARAIGARTALRRSA